MRRARFVGIRSVAGVLAASMAFALALALALTLGIDTAAAKLVVMHGYADLTSATLWIQADAPGPVSVSWRPDSDNEPRQVALVADARTTTAARLTGGQHESNLPRRCRRAEHRDGTGATELGETCRRTDAHVRHRLVFLSRRPRCVRQ
jgi:hypothetical protein